MPLIRETEPQNIEKYDSKYVQYILGHPSCSVKNGVTGGAFNTVNKHTKWTNSFDLITSFLLEFWFLKLTQYMYLSL